MATTVAAPMVLPALYSVPSVGVAVTVEVLRKIITELKSVSAGLVHESVMLPLLPVAEGLVTSAGDWLSMVTVALPVSVPVSVLVPIRAVTVPVIV